MTRQSQEGGLEPEVGVVRPLQDIRVLDLSRILAGPYAAQMLGDLGAEVIKVEKPGHGDESRLYGPPFLRDSNGSDTRDTAMFLAANRNKKSLTVDLSKPEGQEVIRRIAAKSDVLIENFRVGTLRRYGLDYETLHAINPRLVYCSITGFGQTGPYRHRPGYDSIFQAMSGLMSVTGEADGQPGGGPMKVGASLIDVVTALYAVIGILSAVRYRDAAGGGGQHIDLSLVESGVAILSHSPQQYLMTGKAPARRGTEGGGGMPSRMFRAADGQFMLSAGNNAQFARLCDVIGRPDLPKDDRFATNPDRSKNRTELLPTLESSFARWKVADLVAALNKADVPVAPINDYAAVFSDPHFRERGIETTVEHPVAGAVRLLRNPIRYSETPLTGYRAPPQPGAHNRELLTGLVGMTEDEIRSLEERGII